VAVEGGAWEDGISDSGTGGDGIFWGCGIWEFRVLGGSGNRSWVEASEHLLTSTGWL